LVRDQDVTMRNFVAFHENVEAALYGDDNTYTCSDLVVGWFTPANICKVWKSIGVVATADFEEEKDLLEVSFLSQTSRLDENGICLPISDLGKLKASLRYGATVDDPRWHVLRANALRMDTWGSLECREYLNDYINFLVREYSSTFYGEVNGVAWVEIQNTFKTDAELKTLYLGYESNLPWLKEVETLYLRCL